MVPASRSSVAPGPASVITSKCALYTGCVGWTQHTSRVPNYDQSIVDAILARARQVKDPRARNRYTRAALQTGIVESGLQNLDHGDADSEGWRQERKSLYPNPTNVQASVDRFFNEAAQLDRGQPSWQLAADVQRPAAQYRGRYKTVASQAAALLKGGASSLGSAGSPSSAAPASSGSGQAAAPILGDPGAAGDFTGLVGQLLAKPSPVAQSSAVQAPQFSAQLALPKDFHAPTPEPVKAPEAQDGVSASLSLLGTLGGPDPAQRSAATTEGANGSQVEPPAGIAETVGQVRTGTGPVAALGWAKSYLGFKETGENQGGIASYANQRFGFKKAPWCAMFTSLAITKGGAPLSARTASVAEVRRKALAGQGYQRGLISPNAARPGDLILFDDDHIGMVDSVVDGKIRYVGGNQSDGVTMASVPIGRGDIVRPLYGARGRKRR